MKLIPDVPPTMSINCANATSTTPLPSQICTIEGICGFGGFKGKEPNQWFRFITPIFLHAGLIHLGLNMFAQWVLSGQVEKEMGSGGFFILYFAAGIFGNVFGMFTHHECLNLRDLTTPTFTRW
jgi:membrane associated rhomboid family serine protease